jgi:hypothetical protein
MSDFEKDAIRELRRTLKQRALDQVRIALPAAGIRAGVTLDSWETILGALLIHFGGTAWQYLEDRYFNRFADHLDAVVDRWR